MIIQEIFCLLRNGQFIEEKKIPVIDTALFVISVEEKLLDGYRLIGYFGRNMEDKKIKLYAVISDDKEALLFICATKVADSFPSITNRFPQAHLFEREIYEQFGIIPVGHPWLKPVRFHESSGKEEPLPGNHPFFQIEGEEIHEVGVGPVHAGIIEPGHFRFQCHGENVFHLEIQLGYQHRNIEKLLETVPFLRIPFISESIAGDTAVSHATASAMAWESLAGGRVPPRAESLRAIALELERLSNHVGDLGALGADIGFVPASAYFGRLRGEFLNMLMELTGNRYGRSFVRPGGVTFDITSAMAQHFVSRLQRAHLELKEVADLFFDTPSVFERLDGVGALSMNICQELGLVGIAARACGLDQDVRKDHPYGIYRFHHVPTVTMEEGDVYARAMMRWLEIEKSLDFLNTLLRELPMGNLHSACNTLTPDSFAVSLVEGWRGEIMHIIITDNAGKIAHYKVKDPSFHNWFGLAMALRDEQISDFPMINKSFNLSYAGHDL